MRNHTGEANEKCERSGGGLDRPCFFKTPAEVLFGFLQLPE